MSYQNIIEFIENIKDEIKQHKALSKWLFVYFKKWNFKEPENLLPASKLYLQFEQFIKQVMMVETKRFIWV